MLRPAGIDFSADAGRTATERLCCEGWDTVRPGPVPYSMICDGACVDPNYDPNNWGACGHVCPGTQPGCCVGPSVDFWSDHHNWGSCGFSCGGGGAC